MKNTWAQYRRFVYIILKQPIENIHPVFYQDRKAFPLTTAIS